MTWHFLFNSVIFQVLFHQLFLTSWIKVCLKMSCNAFIWRDLICLSSYSDGATITGTDDSSHWTTDWPRWVVLLVKSRLKKIATKHASHSLLSNNDSNPFNRDTKGIELNVRITSELIKTTRWNLSFRTPVSCRGLKLWSWQNVHIIIVSVTSFEGTPLLTSNTVH